MSSRYQRRINTCSTLIIAIVLLIIVLLQWTLSRREPAPAPTATPTPVPTFISRAAIAALPTNTPYLKAISLPTFTPTPPPTHTPTPTTTPTPTATLTPTPAPTYIARVGVELLNLRSGPGVEYDTLVVLGGDEQVEVVGRSVDGGWVAVHLPTGESGWVLADLLIANENMLHLAVITPPPPPTPTPEPSPEAAFDANVRAGPGTNYEIIAPLYAGTPVEVLGKDASGQWYAIRLSDGTEGWVFATLMSDSIDPESLQIWNR